MYFKFYTTKLFSRLLPVITQKNKRQINGKNI